MDERDWISLQRFRIPRKSVNDNGLIGDDSATDRLRELCETRCKVTTWMSPRNYKKILNIGSSLGEAIALKKLGYDVTPIIVHDAISFEKFGIKAIENDACEMLDIPDESIDAVLAIQAFEHIFMPWKALLECYRVLRVGGRLCINFPVFHAEEVVTLQHCSLLEPKVFGPMITLTGFKLLHHEVETVQQNICAEKLSVEEMINYPDEKLLSAYQSAANMIRQYMAVGKK